jgi:hypothetical protein
MFHNWLSTFYKANTTPNAAENILQRMGFRTTFLAYSFLSLLRIKEVEGVVCDLEGTPLADSYILTKLE